MAGGMTSGVTNFGIAFGLSVPPGMAAKARGTQPSVVATYRPAVPAAPSFTNSRPAFSTVPVPAGSRLALVDLYTPSLDRDGLVLIERRGGFDGPLDFDPHPTNAGYTFIAKQFEDALSGLP